MRFLPRFFAFFDELYGSIDRIMRVVLCSRKNTSKALRGTPSPVVTTAQGLFSGVGWNEAIRSLK
jgi:hypothetical protein